LTRYQPENYLANVLEPIGVPQLRTRPRFESIGMNYLLHCLPGAMADKAAAVFSHLQPLLRPGGTLFGSTLLHGGVDRSPIAQRLMAACNANGIFSNAQDDLDGLRQALQARFERFSLEVVGCAALFSGWT